MQLTLSAVASILQTSENNIYRWINEKNLPAEYVNGQYRFNQAQLLEWAALHRMTITPQAFAANGDSPPLSRLDDVLRTGGIIHNLPGSDKTSVLQALVERLPLPADCDRASVLHMTLARERAGSTGIGDGIALPHPRFPIVHPLTPPSVTLAFLSQPIDFGAPDGKPVHTLFAIVSPTVRMHSAMLARLAFALRQPSFQECIRKQSPADEIFAQAARLEETLAQDSTLSPAARTRP
jgi:PTS system nitrogen regulatory IIA component